MSWSSIICDVGSTWMGKKAYAKELIHIAQDAGADAVKCQLFEGEEYKQAGNIEMPHDLFRELYQYGVEQGFPVTASVFNKKALELLLPMKLHHIKFSYSQRNQSELIHLAIKNNHKVVVSSGVMDADLPKEVIKLYIALENGQPVYPNCREENFEGLFPMRFQGFSDHSLGYRQAVKAVQSGAYFIEKHIRPSYSECDSVPDGKFALKPRELKEFVQRVRNA